MCNHVLSIDKEAFFDFQLPELSREDWEELLACAAKQGMLPTVMQIFEGRQIENQQLKKVILKWYAVVQGSRFQYQMCLKTMCELAAMFAEDGIDVMFFKGASLAQLYTNPEWRVFSDIDFYLYGKWKEGVDAMEQHGICNRQYYHHNTEASLHGILLENHYDFIERVNHPKHLILDDKLKELATTEGHQIKVSFLGDDIKNAYVMTPTMNAIFLLRHMAAHFASETIPLRMLYDWTLFLKKEEKTIDWDTVLPLYECSDLIGFVGIIQYLLHTYLGMTFEAVPHISVDEKKALRVWDSIVNPPVSNPYKKYSMKYLEHEGKNFLGNRWKHKIVYPHESYSMLALHYAWSIIKRKLGFLKM
jgi:hypothetical protein